MNIIFYRSHFGSRSHTIWIVFQALSEIMLTFSLQFQYGRMYVVPSWVHLLPASVRTPPDNVLLATPNALVLYINSLESLHKLHNFMRCSHFGEISRGTTTKFIYLTHTFIVDVSHNRFRLHSWEDLIKLMAMNVSTKEHIYVRVVDIRNSYSVPEDTMFYPTYPQQHQLKRYRAFPHYSSSIAKWEELRHLFSLYRSWNSFETLFPLRTRARICKIVREFLGLPLTTFEPI
jgi:hypothetical protein